MKTLLVSLLLMLPLMATAQTPTVNLYAANHKVAEILKADRQAFPERWNFVVLDERTWNSYSKVSSGAFSILDKHITALRAAYVMAATPERIHRSLMHEAGHAICGCVSERIADEFADKH
jgi:hypothetical protein